MSAVLVKRAEEQARLLLEAIMAMVRRLEHIVECKNPDCNLADMDVLAGLNIRHGGGRSASKLEREKYHKESDAYNTIRQSFLKMSLFPDLRYELLLYHNGSTFGRIVGEPSQHYTPISAKFEYQDCSTPWAIYPLTSAEQQAILDFANCFAGYFGIAAV